MCGDFIDSKAIGASDEESFPSLDELFPGGGCIMAQPCQCCDGFLLLDGSVRPSVNERTYCSMSQISWRAWAGGSPVEMGCCVLLFTVLFLASLDPVAFSLLSGMKDLGEQGVKDPGASPGMSPRTQGLTWVGGSA
ncbi:unnamed protein product [Caretta caretta]